MGILNFLLNNSVKRRIRILQATLELLTERVVDLEEAISAAIFPDKKTRERLSAAIGQYVMIYSENHVLRGNLVSVHQDCLEIHDEKERQVIIPSAFISRIEFTQKQN
ncbi:hypothetical protein D3C76_31880 [compost metagenome]